MNPNELPDMNEIKQRRREINAVKKPKDLEEMIERTGYPTDQRTNSSGYSGNYADPMVDIDNMIKQFTEDVVAIKRYALEKSLVNIKWALKTEGKKESYYAWCKTKLYVLQAEYDELNEKYPILQLRKEDVSND